jgi:hypothetical protein
MNANDRQGWMRRLLRGILLQALLFIVFLAPLLLFSLLSSIIPGFQFSTAYGLISMVWIFGALVCFGVWRMRKDA